MGMINRLTITPSGMILVATSGFRSPVLEDPYQKLYRFELIAGRLRNIDVRIIGKGVNVVDMTCIKKGEHEMVAIGIRDYYKNCVYDDICMCTVPKGANTKFRLYSVWPIFNTE
jgi:hypothetical protein